MVKPLVHRLAVLFRVAMGSRADKETDVVRSSQDNTAGCHLYTAGVNPNTGATYNPFANVTVGAREAPAADCTPWRRGGSAIVRLATHGR